MLQFAVDPSLACAIARDATPDGAKSRKRRKGFPYFYQRDLNMFHASCFFFFLKARSLGIHGK